VLMVDACMATFAIGGRRFWVVNIPSIPWASSLIQAYVQCFAPSVQGLQVGLIDPNAEGQDFTARAEILSPFNVGPFIESAVSFIRSARETLHLRMDDRHLKANAFWVGSETAVRVSQRIQWSGGSVNLKPATYQFSFANGGVNRLEKWLGLYHPGFVDVDPDPFDIGFRIFHRLGIPDLSFTGREKGVIQREKDVTMRGTFEKDSFRHEISLKASRNAEGEIVRIAIKPLSPTPPGSGLIGPELELWDLAAAGASGVDPT